MAAGTSGLAQTEQLTISAYAAQRDNPAPARRAPLDLSDWELVWSDEFDYPDAELDQRWVSREGEFESEWVVGRRWRRNAVAANGILELRNRLDPSDPHLWSSASIWTKESFGYGYYEARYRYAGAYGTNNSFWLWPKNPPPDGQKACEIDINEGHFPNVINTNIHNWTDVWRLPDGRETHEDNQLHHTLDGKREHRITLNDAVLTSGIRLVSTNPAAVHLAELSIFGTQNVQVGIRPETPPELLNFTRSKDAALSSVGSSDQSRPDFAVDGRPETRWVSPKYGRKWFSVEWTEPKAVRSVHIRNGWQDRSEAVRNLMTDFSLEYRDGDQWIAFYRYNAQDDADYSRDFNTFGLEWTEDYFKWYRDGKLFHTSRNNVCFSKVNILLSMAILNGEIAGPVTPAIDGTSMKVDYVRYYRRKNDPGAKR